jgi:hypothetical protein
LWQGRASRALQNFGSAFHRAAGVFAPDRVPDATTTVVIDYWSDADCDLSVQAFLGKDSVVLGRLSGSPGTWQTAELSMAGSSDSA